jgi:hypothetical protein
MQLIITPGLGEESLSLIINEEEESLDSKLDASLPDQLPIISKSFNENKEMTVKEG